jgi:hypothetical protein
MRNLSPSIACALALLVGTTTLVAQEKADLAGQDAFVELAGNLLVDPPVNINDPPPKTALEIKADDMVLLQIRYPIVPPMPASVEVTSRDQHVAFVSAATTAREVALLERQPRVGGQIGVGFVQVLVRGTSAGKDQVTVRVKLADGNIKSLLFNFNVAADK